MRIRIVARATDNPAFRGGVIVSITIVGGPLGVVGGAFGCNHITILAVTDPANAIAGCGDTLHRPFGFADRVIDMPNGIYRVSGYLCKMVFEATIVRNHIYGHIIHDLPCAANKRLKAEHLVAIVACASHGVRIANGVHVACGATRPLAIATF